MCFIQIVEPFDYGSYCLIDLEIQLTAGVTSRQGMLTPPTQVYPEIRVCSILRLVFPTGLMRLIIVRYVCRLYVYICKVVKYSTNCYVLF
jgi:hypothetical protein